MTNKISTFRLYNKFQTPQVISTAKATSQLLAVASGVVSLYVKDTNNEFVHLQLTNVLHVPDLLAPILSMKQLAQGNEIKVFQHHMELYIGLHTIPINYNSKTPFLSS